MAWNINMKYLLGDQLNGYCSCGNISVSEMYLILLRTAKIIPYNFK